MRHDFQRKIFKSQQNVFWFVFKIWHSSSKLLYLGSKRLRQEVEHLLNFTVFCGVLWYLRVFYGILPERYLEVRFVQTFQTVICRLEPLLLKPAKFGEYEKALKGLLPESKRKIDFKFSLKAFFRVVNFSKKWSDNKTNFICCLWLNQYNSSLKSWLFFFQRDQNVKVFRCITINVKS